MQFRLGWVGMVARSSRINSCVELDYRWLFDGAELNLRIRRIFTLLKMLINVIFSLI